MIFVSSVAHLWGQIDFNTILQPDGSWVPAQFRAYARSKLANVLFAREINRREKSIHTYVAHPGKQLLHGFRSDSGLRILNFKFQVLKSNFALNPETYNLISDFTPCWISKNNYKSESASDSIEFPDIRANFDLIRPVPSSGFHYVQAQTVCAGSIPGTFVLVKQQNALCIIYFKRDFASFISSSIANRKVLNTFLIKFELSNCNLGLYLLRFLCFYFS